MKLSYLESKNISMSRDFRNHLQNGDNIYTIQDSGANDMF